MKGLDKIAYKTFKTNFMQEEDDKLRKIFKETKLRQQSVDPDKFEELF